MMAWRSGQCLAMTFSNPGSIPLISPSTFERRESRRKTGERIKYCLKLANRPPPPIHKVEWKTGGVLVPHVNAMGKPTVDDGDTGDAEPTLGRLIRVSSGRYWKE